MAYPQIIAGRALAAVTAAAALCTCTPLPLTVAAPVATTATVLGAVDGDTIDVKDDDVRGRLRIRLLGLDSPESKIS